MRVVEGRLTELVKSPLRGRGGFLTRGKHIMFCAATYKAASVVHGLCCFPSASRHLESLAGEVAVSMSSRHMPVVEGNLTELVKSTLRGHGGSLTKGEQIMFCSTTYT